MIAQMFAYAFSSMSSLDMKERRHVIRFVIDRVFFLFDVFHDLFAFRDLCTFARFLLLYSCY